MALDFLYSIARFGHSFVASSLSASFERKMSHFIDLRVLGTWNYEFYVQKKGSASSRFKKIYLSASFRYKERYKFKNNVA